MNNKDWGLAEVWNKSLERIDVREPKSRDNLWASELGKANIDLWLKMKGTPASNPPNARSMRKFEAGNVFEWLVSLILKRSGILQDQQKWCAYQYPGLLKVTGKADFIAGGKPNLEMFHRAVAFDLGLPDVFVRATEAILKHFEQNYPDGLEKMPLEIKSVSSFMFEMMEKSGVPSGNHRMQLFHYLKADGWTKGNLVYISRDDLRIMEFPIMNPSPVELEYKTAIEKISNYVKNDERPPLEKLIDFNPETGKFQKNWNVAYSSYLTMLYGFKDQQEYDDIYSSMAGKWNRVMTRIKTGAKMTDKNKAMITEIEAAGFSIEDLKDKIVEEKDEIIE